MVAFLLQFRLLQLVWISRVGNGNEKGLWGSEKKTLLVSLPLYVLGGFIALFVNWKRNKYSSTYHVAVYQEHSLWGDLRSYGGLVLDGFLLPQILLNIFQMSKESALSHSFYVGTTFDHLLPHAYDLYRAQNYVHRHVDGSYIYANPSADFYSAASDVIIPCAGVLFAGAIYLQQRFGGRCFLPRRFRKSEVYGKVPVVSSDSVTDLETRRSKLSIFHCLTPSVFYNEHCASIIPEAVPAVLEETTNTTFMELGMSHYSGGDMILGRNLSDDYYDRKLFFGTTSNVYKTNTTGVYMIETYLKFGSVVSYPVAYVHSDFRRGQKLEFLFNGFWSESSEKLCMVGSAPWYTSEGNILDLDAVLKLNYAKNKTISNILVSGVLESLSSPDDLSYFDSISILALSKENPYKYTLVSGELNQGNSGEIDYPPNSSLSLQPSRVCSRLTKPFTSYKVDYASKCISLQNCTSLGEEFGFPPNFMTLIAIDCSNDGQTIRYLVEFSKMSFVVYYKFLNPTRTFVAEASWDAKQNRLSIVACRILNQFDPLGSAHVGDCSIRMSLRYPAVWSIGNPVMTEGQIWTTKSVDESGYFDRLKFQSY
ncbi:hypothetical protein RJ639_017623 [Escallonia herrerae]|uniref:RING-type E3 ubiquitin transferase n=1 Tax=Escallonia herrerae TaxID=1293975 RepID=A0AA88VBM9_9ASTE|nr:hypothetical protein RJ639_017623 [Escallonia herrerae]